MTGPGLPQTGPGLPVTGPGLPQTGPGLPQTGPGLPHTGPGLPQTGPGLPVTGPGLPVIEFDQVGKTYPGPPATRALAGCTLRVRRGEYIAIRGRSGSGKSTLLNIAGLLDRPTAGTYRFDGVDTSGLPEVARTALRGRRIGFVFQSFHLLPYRTACENVEVALMYGGAPRTQRREQAVQALGRVGLAHRLLALPTTLSGGERQRVAIARALVNRPSVLLCDEPTGNLDSATAAGVLALVDELHATGQTIVVITHDASVATRASRTLTLRDGELAEETARPGPASARPAGSDRR